MSDADFETITAIAADRSDIRIVMSSTPTGRRSYFYKACVDKSVGYVEHFHPSTHNPNWNEQMESEFRAQLSEQAYIKEILAEFGTEDTGVFPKERVDESLAPYTYDKVTYYQKELAKKLGIEIEDMSLKAGEKMYYNAFRTVGVDFDKYGASSSIIVLDYLPQIDKFKVIKRIEVPRGEYSYDNALKKIIEVNEIYNPSWIYCDAGSGEYIIERLHITGDENPTTGLKHKVRRIQFSQKLDIMDPITKEIDRKEAKEFMINQLQISFERGRMMLSQFDETLHKQLVDYTVVRKTQSGKAVFTSENEHFVDALALANLAFVMEFKEIANTIKGIEFTSKILQTSKGIAAQLKNTNVNIESNVSNFNTKRFEIDTSERRGERPSYYKVPLGSKSTRQSVGWGSRGPRGGGGFRSSW